MASWYMFGLVLCVALANVKGHDLHVGTSLNNQLIFTDVVTLSSIPLKVRTKNYFYNNNTSQSIIKGISAIDLDKGKARATITSGGVGSTFVNIKLKSERGSGLKYQIQIFA